MSVTTINEVHVSFVSVVSYNWKFTFYPSCVEFNKSKEKGNGKTFPVFNQVPRHEDAEGSQVTAPPFLTSAIDRGELLASRTSRFTSKERATTTPWIEG
jgi:hypothetical protein